MENNNHRELAITDLRAVIDPELFPFQSTDSLESPEQKIVGQDRAIEAIKFGMGMKKPGYNIFIAGPAKAGLTYMAKSYVEEQARTGETPPDWCYVYNFKEKDRPKSLSLRPGMGKELKKDVEEFIKVLRKKIPEVFSSEDYAARDREVHESFDRRKQEMLSKLSMMAKNMGFSIQMSPMGMMSVPTGMTGEPMTQAEIALLSPEQMKSLQDRSETLKEHMERTVKAIQKEEEDFKERHKKLEHEVALFIASQIMAHLTEKYEEEPQVLEFLVAMQDDILENIDELKPKNEAAQQQQQAMMQQQGLPMPPPEMAFRKYEINVLIDNSETQGAPVVIESNTAYPNLFGSIEKQAWFGALITDHTLIKGGAVHRANGGYLVLKALDLLRMGISYEALQRMLLDGEIKIEDLAEFYGIFSTRSIKPEPIPLQLKIILTGDAEIYHLLYRHDDRFRKHFKVKAHLDNEMDRKEEANLQYARMIGRYCRDESLRHLDRSGVARVIEYAMERTDDQDKLTLEIGDVTDLIMEADYLAGQENAELIGNRHIEEAIQKRIYRSNLYEQRLQEVVNKDIFWVETDGYKIGQVNGLTVLMTGDHEFGSAKRITAAVSVGREGAVSIDRESKMSGNIHTKGLLTLGGFLKERFARNKPISLSASLAFEQSYGMVDGDSASSTELYALLSAIARVPIYQGIAVTGSVSQKGEIQPIGGVNHKIKGFFEICRHKGLNGRQGVIVPSKNVRNLMLPSEVLEAVKDGKFHVWSVSTIEEGIEILTGMRAGEIREEDNTYPEGTLFRKVDDRLTELSEIVQKFSMDSENGKRHHQEDSAGGCPHCGG